MKSLQEIEDFYLLHFPDGIPEHARVELSMDMNEVFLFQEYQKDWKFKKDKRLYLISCKLQ